MIDRPLVGIKLICLGLLLWVPVVGATGKLHVLAVHSYSQEYPWTLGQHRGFVDRLQQELEVPAHISTEYLNTKRRAWTPDYARLYAQFIIDKYDPTAIDAVYVTDDNALRFALEYLNAMLSDVPVFFSGVNDFGMIKKLDENLVTGVFEKKDVLRNIDLLQRLVGQDTELIVVGDASNTYQAIATEVRSAVAQRPGLVVHYVASADSAEIRAELVKHPDVPVLLTTLGGIRSENGEPLSLPEIVSRIRGATRAVIISMEDAYLLPGVQGGYVTSSVKQGETAAGLLLAWWGGTPLRDLTPVLGSPNEFVFNETEMATLGLRVPGDLLARARLIAPQSGFFERNQAIILGVLVLLSGALIFAVFLLIINMGVRNE
ncbi:MAG: hypothetical protein KDH88_20265 [Chromatiales bacterium]|nr:hypothetical protein [Chromatiales bacterium]